MQAKHKHSVKCPDCQRHWINADRETGQTFALCPKCRLTNPTYTRKVRK